MCVNNKEKKYLKNIYSKYLLVVSQLFTLLKNFRKYIDGFNLNGYIFPIMYYNYKSKDMSDITDIMSIHYS